MPSVLIVDDSHEKYERVVKIIREEDSNGYWEILWAKSQSEALQQIKRRQFDLLILDLNLPLRTGEPADERSGMNLLNRVTRDCYPPKYIVGLTEYEKLLKENAASFSRELWHIIKYDRASTDWEELLRRKLIYIAESIEIVSRISLEYDLAIITALQEPELAAVLELPGNWKKLSIGRDSTNYYAGRFVGRTKEIRIVAASANEMGMPASVALSMKMISTFRPRILAMCGIAAGIAKARVGDVIAADISWDCGSGKVQFTRARGGKFLPAPSQIAIDPSLKTILIEMAGKKEMLKEIVGAWTGQVEVPHPLKVIVGPVVSGASVVASIPERRRILAQSRKVIGLDMETYGVFVAARHCTEPRPMALSFKSMCDFASSHKNDKYQQYAAFTSANFLYRFATSHL